MNRISTLIVLALLIALAVACTKERTQQAKLTGIEASFKASEAAAGQIKNLATGRLVLTKENGEEVHAFYPREMEDNLRGGQILEVKQIKGTSDWVVTRIVKEP